MVANHISIKLSSEFVDEAKREAEILRRSVGAQVEYWARIGQAIENTPGFSIGRIREALNGTLRLDGLSAAEQTKALERMSAVFDAPDAATRAYYAALGEEPGAVGTNGHGGVIRRQPSVRKRHAD